MQGSAKKKFIKKSCLNSWISREFCYIKAIKMTPPSDEPCEELCLHRTKKNPALPCEILSELPFSTFAVYTAHRFLSKSLIIYRLYWNLLFASSTKMTSEISP